MAFPDKVVRDIWKIHSGRCTCFDTTHGHLGICYKPLIWENRGKEIAGSWEAHHIRADGCMECYKIVKESQSSDLCLAGLKTK